MFHLIKAAIFLALITAVNVSLAAQNVQDKMPASGQPPKPGASDSSGDQRGSDEKPIPPERQRALGLLDKLFDTAKDFGDDSLKIKVQAQIADALWDHDEPRARRQFEETFRAIAAIKVKQEERGSSSSSDSGLKFQLRNEVINLVSRRDPGLAGRLVESVADLSPEKKDDSSKEKADEKDDDSENPSREEEIKKALLYLHSAMNLAEADPQRAVELAKLGLSRSGDATVFFKLAGLLRTLSREDQRLADNLFSYALSVASHDPMQLAEKIKWLATYALPDFEGANNRPSGPTDRPNTRLILQFLNFVFNALTQANTAQASATGDAAWKAGVQASFDYQVVQQLLPYFEQHLPDQTEAIRARLNDAWLNVPAVAERDRLTGANHKPDVQELVSQAETARNPQERDRLYVRAVQQAVRESDFEQALSIVEKIGARQLRSSYDSSTRYQAAMAAIGKEDFEAAYRYGRNLPSLPQRALVFDKLARAFENRKEIGRAMGIISEVAREIGKAGDGPDKARAMLIVANAASRLDPSVGFEVMKSAVEAINHADAGQKSNRTPSQAGFDLSTLSFDQGFPLLARYDFERALLLAREIEKKEASVLVQLALCRGALIEPREPRPEGKAVSRIVSGDVPAREVPVFQVKAEGDGANAAIGIRGKAAMLDVHSRGGIGSATVEHVSGPMPEKIVARLHLKGLEEFRLSYDRTVITARVSSSDGRNIVQSLDSPGGAERPIAPDSPFRMEIKIASDQVAPRIPLEQGHFEITLPRDVLGKGRRSFSIRWIDFYR